MTITAWCVLSACGDSSGGSAGSAGSTGRGPDTTDATDAPTTTATPTTAAATEGGSGSDSVSQSTTAGDSSSDSQATGSASATTTGVSATTGEASSGDTTQGASVSDGSTGSGTTGASTDTSSGTDTGEPPCEPGGVGEQFSFLWIANTDQGSVSKINTNTMVEMARYYTDPVQSGAASPSRTSVSLDGRFVVVSNRDTGSITKIAANEVDCVDKNNDDVIQTSKDKAQLLPFDQDECILWTTKLTINNHQWGPRATTFGIPDWNIDTCAYENEKVWVGYMVGPASAQMARLNSYTGAIEEKVDIIDFPLYGSYSPYGAAVDPDGNIWTSAVANKAAIRIDVKTLQVKRWDSPDADAHYGITIGADGRVWFANYGGFGGHGGVSFFDPKTELWKVIPGTQGNLWRSVAADDKGRIWVSNNGGPFGCGLLEIDGEDETITNFHTFTQCGTPVGVGLDGKGKVWMIDYNGWTWQMDPMTFEKKLLPVANVHYTYSDFTGSGLSGIVPQ
ncbi:lyase [Nannocystis sp.]|uniref:Vgb family protein n=1 Tax=Nannocystis sp. TaxID=1962667 RepID=UPI0025DC2887|nr:lyase [Nannocystis sp.]MBK7829458.1 lyase [Nannocystis sp.]